MTENNPQAVEAATAAIGKQREVDRLLQQQSKDEWFAKAALAAAAPYLTADMAAAIADEIHDLSPGIETDPLYRGMRQAERIARLFPLIADQVARRFAQDGAGDE